MIKCYVVILIVHNTRTTDLKIDHIHDFLLKTKQDFYTRFYPNNTSNQPHD